MKFRLKSRVVIGIPNLRVRKGAQRPKVQQKVSSIQVGCKLVSRYLEGDNTMMVGGIQQSAPTT